MNPILKNLLLFCIFIVPFKTSLAQAPTLAKVVPPSPNMQAFQKYGNIPVSNYTGLPNISVPLYTIKFRDISYPISLSYHASGIKVAEEASQVGLGWALNALSSISRNVIGDDDFYGSGYFHSSFNSVPDFSGGQGPRDMISQGTSLNLFNKNQSPTMFTRDMTAEFTSIPPYDFQQDQYNYNFNGRSGKFVLNRDYQAIIQKQEKLKISCTSDATSWKIIADDGFIYDFTAYETYHDELGDHKSAWYLTKVTSPAGNFITFNYTSVNRTVKTIGAWSETWDYYDPPTDVGIEQVLFTHNTGHQAGTVPGKEYALVVLDNIDFNTGVVKFNYSDRDDLVDDKKLDGISIFTKNAAGVVSTTPLKTVSLTYGYFDHGVIDDDAGTGTANNSKRLKLLQVQQTGYYGGNAVSENPYVFSYSESNFMPAKGSFARDHWGYYNGITNTSTLVPSVVPLNSPDPITAYMGVPGPEREPNINLTGTYSLTRIQYPTGGSTEFQYEANDFDEQKSRVNDFSYFNKTFTVQSKSVTLNYDNQIGQKLFPSDTLDISDEYMYVPNPFRPGGNSTVSVRFVIRFSDFNACTNLPNPFPVTDKVTFDFYDVTGTTLMFHKDASYFPTCTGGNTDNCMSCSGPAFTYLMTNLSLPPAKYRLRVHVDPSYSASIQDIHFTFTYYVQTGSQNLNAVAGNTNYTAGGGQRIKRIIDHDAANPANINVKKFNYHYFSNGQEYSYGRRMSHPVYTNFSFSYDKHVRHYGVYTEVHNITGTHMMRSADSNIPLDGSAGGSVVGYDQVEVLDGENGENGKSVYTYVNQPDYVSDYSMYDLPIQAPFASNVPELGNGNLLTETTYKNVAGQFIKVKQVANTYYEVPAIQNDVFGLENRVPAFYHFEDETLSNSLPTDPAIRDIVTYFNMRSKFIYLGQTNQKIYDPLDNTNTKYAETNSVYNYDNTTHLQPTSVVTSNSKGETVTTYNKYPLDYTLTGTVTDPTALGVSKLVAKNMIKPLIEKYVKVTNADGSNVRVTNALFTKYKTTTPMPDVMQMNNSITPMAGFTPATIAATSTSVDSRYKPYVVFDNYDSWGNLVQQHKYLGTNDSYIWGYNQQYPIAQASNAKYNEIMFSSFDEPVGWSGPLVYDASFKRTGLSSGRIDNTNTTEVTSLNSNWLTVSLTAAKKYHYSAWVYSNGPVADLYLLMKRAGETGYNTYADYATTSVTGKWTYIEKDYLVPADVTQMTLRVDNNGALNGGTQVWFDDVRLYPSDGQMTTYTYEPLVGVTSATDGRNATTYYEYDGLARLLNVKDQNGKILKNYSYNYVSLAPVWTDNGTVQCVTNGVGQNTGEQLKQQKDANPLSPTYNQTRWVSNGTNTTACPLPATIYVQQTIGSTSVSNGLTYRTLKFNTYSDANCTVLVNAPVTLTVNYSYVTTRSYADGRTPNPVATTTNATITITAGTNQATSGSIIISGCSGTADKQICYTPSTQITVQPGTGYVAVNPEI